MFKSATEQFQIKKKRKHPPCNGGASSTPQLVSPSLAALHPVAGKRYAAPKVIIKENFADFQVGDKYLTHALHFQPLTSAEEAADIFLDTEYSSAATAAASEPAVTGTTPLVPVHGNCDKSSSRTKTTAATVAAPTTTNCLRDKSQILLARASPANNNNVIRIHPNTPISTSAIIMPLQHGFYVKGAALARKRGMKSLKVSNSTTSSVEEAKRPRHAVAAAVALENNNINNNNNSNSVRSTSLSGAQATTANNTQLSYMLGESLARHGRLQEAFDIYALLSSEQMESFIPLEKLNILATALLEHIRILSSSNSKKDEDINSQAQLKGVEAPPNVVSANANTLTTQWQLAVASLTKSPSYPLKTFTSDFLNSAEGNNNKDLYNPTRERSHTKSPTPQEDYDPLLCPLCREILRSPVTTNCGHTFCRQCCETITMCNICNIKFPRWQRDEMVVLDTVGQKLDQLTSLSTATSTTISTSSLASAVQTFRGNQQYTVTPTTTASPLGLHDLPRLRIGNSVSQSALALSPTTVTTTSIACTTDTATTTMASTSGLTTHIAGTGGLAVNSASRSSSNPSSNDNMKFMPDVLVRRLVEKWWGADLQARKILETATSYMHLNLLDDALKFCNVSLEKSPSNFKSLLLRAEVLRKMNHYQSSLADVDNALKTRYTSAKAHYLRSLALSDLSRSEEALYEICLAISLDKSANLSSTELFQHDLTKILQKLLSQTPKCIRLDLNSVRSKCPYGLYSEQRLRRRNLNIHDEETMQPFIEEEDFLSATYGKECDILADDDVLSCTDFLNCADKRTTYASIAKKYEMELKRQTSRKHFRRKWMQRETELLPFNEMETMRSSGQFRNVLERLQQEIIRLRKVQSSPEYALKQRITVSPSLIDASDFDCVLCCRTFWKPVVTPCGHTYCLVCLDRCMDYTSSCPLCMSPLVEPSVSAQQGASSPIPLVLTKRPVTKFLEAAMKHFIPDSYNKRFRQEMVMEPSVPIFICTTAFPYVPCPLFVYEPRYRLMVRRAVESGEKQFGIVQPHSGKSRYYDYGCILDIRDCVLLGDGCSILSTLGCKRFKILARNEKDGYETAKVEYIHDEAIPDEHLSYVIGMHDIVLEKAIDWYSSLGEDLKHEILQSYGEMPMVEDSWETRDDGPAWAWWIIALLPLRPQLKVDILATTSLEKRLRAIEKTIHSMPGNYRYQRVPQNCNVAVVVHNQTHHDLDNSHHLTAHHHRHHHHLHRHPDDEDGDVGDEDEDVNADIDNENDIDLDVNADEEDNEHSAMQHHIQNIIDANEDDVDVVAAIGSHAGQQHATHLVQHPQLQLLQTQQQHFENVASIDECCQRTSAHEMTTTINGENDDDEMHEQSTNEQQQHHHHQHHHHHHHHQQNLQTAHTHSLLL